MAEQPRFLAEWLLRRSGPLTSTVAEVVAFHRTRGGLPAADIQFHMGPAYYEDHGAETYDGHAMVIAPVLVSPKARGRVWLRSDDPTDKPRILTNSLSEPEDLASLVAGVKLAREIGRQPDAAEIVTREIKPGSDATDDADLEADIRRRLMLIYHPVGTCRMSDTARRGGGRQPPARPRPRCPAGHRRLDHARHPGREHQRADDDGGREGRRPDPGADAR